MTQINPNTSHLLFKGPNYSGTEQARSHAANTVLDVMRQIQPRRVRHVNRYKWVATLSYIRRSAAVGCGPDIKLIIGE